MAAFDNDVRARLRRLLGPQRWEVQDRLWELHSVAGDSRLNLTPQLLSELINNDGANLAEIVRCRDTANRRKPGLRCRTPFEPASRYCAEGGRRHGPMYDSSDDDTDTDSLTSSDSDSDVTDSEAETDYDLSSDDVSIHDESKNTREAGDNESMAGNLNDNVSVHGIRIVDDKSRPATISPPSTEPERRDSFVDTSASRTKERKGFKQRVLKIFRNLFSCTRANSDD